MPRAATTRKQVIQDFRRSEILAAAAKVFGQKGYDATHMLDIAKAARLAKGTLYLYFSSKDVIYEGVIKQAMTELSSLTEEHVNRENEFEGRLRAFIRVRIAYWHEKQLLYRVILSLNSEERTKKRSIAWQRKGVEYLAELYKTAAGAGEIADQDFMAAAWTTMDAIRGMNERRTFAEGTPIEHDSDFLTGFFLNALQHPVKGAHHQGS
jgi:AcrR family transcriptional regulator